MKILATREGKALPCAHFRKNCRQIIVDFFVIRVLHDEYGSATLLERFRNPAE